MKVRKDPVWLSEDKKTCDLCDLGFSDPFKPDDPNRLFRCFLAPVESPCKYFVFGQKAWRHQQAVAWAVMGRIANSNAVKDELNNSGHKSPARQKR
jgi:hypothetical protein